jgi:hypothetical protein
MRVTGFLTNTGHGGPGRQLADLELRHRRHARVEDRIRAAKDTGLRNLPFYDTDQNRLWVSISALAQDLLAWCARLALPATAAGYEPKRLRLRILAVGRLVRTARRRLVGHPPDRLTRVLGRPGNTRIDLPWVSSRPGNRLPAGRGRRRSASGVLVTRANLKRGPGTPQSTSHRQFRRWPAFGARDCAKRVTAAARKSLLADG